MVLPRREMVLVGLESAVKVLDQMIVHRLTPRATYVRSRRFPSVENLDEVLVLAEPGEIGRARSRDFVGGGGVVVDGHVRGGRRGSSHSSSRIGVARVVALEVLVQLRGMVLEAAKRSDELELN